MELKLIGSDCSNGIKIKKNLKKASKELKTKLDIIEVPMSSKDKYQVKVVPTIIINNEKVTEGEVPTEKELIKMLKELDA